MQTNRIYHPWHEWEEVSANMWGTETMPKEAKKSAVDFMKDCKRFGESMLLVVDTWQISCENHLTDLLSNRRAWLGCAAVANALGVPENVTRLAWSELSLDEKKAANLQADNAIKKWEIENERFDNEIHPGLGRQLLLNGFA